MDVDVYAADGALAARRFHPYGDPARRRRCRPARTGSRWPRRQKHWIQALLHEDIVDPLRGDLRRHRLEQPAAHEPAGGWTGERRHPGRHAVPPRREPAAPDAAGRRPSIGLFEIPNSTRGFEAAGQARYLFDQVWDLPYDDVTAAATSRPAWPASMSSSSRTATRTTRCRRSAPRASGRCATGSMPAAAWSPGRVARGRRQGRRLHGQARQLAHQRARHTLRVSLDAASPLADRHRRSRLGHVPGRRRRCSPVSGTPSRPIPAAGTPDYATSGLAIDVDSLAGIGGARRRGRRRRTGRSCSPSTRTSGPGRRAPSGCCGTPSSAPERRGFAARACGRLEGSAPRPRRPPPMRSRRSRPGLGDPDPGRRRPMRPRRPRSCIAMAPRSCGSTVDGDIAVPRRQPQRPVVRRAPVLLARSSRDLETAGHRRSRAASLP